MTDHKECLVCGCGVGKADHPRAFELGYITGLLMGQKIEKRGLSPLKFLCVIHQKAWRAGVLP